METIKKIYFYKMTVDSGGAPCVHDNVLSLSICKPQIRSTAQEGDWIIGFGGKDLGEKLIYMAQITEKLSGGEYYKSEKYFNRPDCIYRWDMETKKYYWEEGKKYHKNGEHIEHDLQNENVLLFPYASQNYAL